MEEKEYKEKLTKIKEDYREAEMDLHVQFGLSKAIYVVGQKIKKHDTIILIDRVKVGIGLSLPYPIYQGVELTKKLEPKKNGERNAIHDNDNIKLLTP